MDMDVGADGYHSTGKSSLKNVIRSFWTSGDRTLCKQHFPNIKASEFGMLRMHSSEIRPQCVWVYLRDVGWEGTLREKDPRICWVPYGCRCPWIWVSPPSGRAVVLLLLLQVEISGMLILEENYSICKTRHDSLCLSMLELRPYLVDSVRVRLWKLFLLRANQVLSPNELSFLTYIVTTIVISFELWTYIYSTPFESLLLYNLHCTMCL